MDKSIQEALATVRQSDKELALLRHVAATLSWDQETYMPEAAVEEKSDQSSLLETYSHRVLTAPALAEALATLGADQTLVSSPDLGTAGARLSAELSEIERALVRNLYREQSRATKIPAELVAEMAKTGALSQSAWAKARKENNFAAFKPFLEKMVDLKRQEAAAVGYKDHPYDALLDSYEPGMKTAEVEEVFLSLRERLVPLVQKIADSPQVEDSFLERIYPTAGQEAFGYDVLKAIGYDLKRGRMDLSAHPFTTSLGVDDVRITTRYAEDFFKTGIFSIVHEAGHGLYELGFGPDIRGTLLADGTSLGIHESQSRTWENMVGRSRPFWNHFLPVLKGHFPGLIDDVDADRFYRGINKVEPSHIRVEADEVTYSLHIMLRFFIEVRLVKGDIQVSDLPELWRSQSKELLGIVPPTDALGVLQDVHWSFGLFGYFPTYSLGNIIGAQFYQVMAKELGDIGSLVAAGKFAPILDWLRTRIHVHGSAKTAGELLSDICGGGLDAGPFLAYLETKYAEIYGF